MWTLQGWHDVRSHSLLDMASYKNRKGQIGVGREVPRPAGSLRSWPLNEVHRRNFRTIGPGMRS
jgi:hypothetical protein